jgi:hypothetical protein
MQTAYLKIGTNNRKNHAFMYKMPQLPPRDNITPTDTTVEAINEHHDEISLRKNLARVNIVIKVFLVYV